MFSTYYPSGLMLVALSFLISLGGCRNPGPFNNNANIPLSGLTGPTRIAPPSTYSLQFPGNQNQPYYNNGSATARQLPLGQPGASNQQSPNVNAQNGWQPTGSVPAVTPSAGSTSRNQIQQQGVANQTNLVSVAERLPAQINTNGNRQPGGLSYIDATNFRTTAIDERRDQSRLPVTDASLVRAPTQFTPSASVGRFNIPAYPQYAAGRGPYNAYAVPQQIAYSRQPVRPTAVVGNFAPPTFAQPSRQTYQGLAVQNNQVLAQSTAYADPNLQSGWRGRELTASRDSLNR